MSMGDLEQTKLVGVPLVSAYQLGWLRKSIPCAMDLLICAPLPAHLEGERVHAPELAMHGVFIVCSLERNSVSIFLAFSEHGVYPGHVPGRPGSPRDIRRCLRNVPTTSAVSQRCHDSLKAMAFESCHCLGFRVAIRRCIRSNQAIASSAFSVQSHTKTCLFWIVCLQIGNKEAAVHFFSRTASSSGQGWCGTGWSGS
jgi:hypothetical protein